jgi:hypothetical protein
VERATVAVDVAPVGRVAQGDDLRAEAAEEFGRESGSGAVGAVEDDLQAVETQPGRDLLDEEVQIAPTQFGRALVGRVGGRAVLTAARGVW